MSTPPSNVVVVLMRKVIFYIFWRKWKESWFKNFSFLQWSVLFIGINIIKLSMKFVHWKKICEGMNIIFKNYKNISIFPIINAIYNRWLPRFSHRFCDSSIFLFFASILNNDGCKIYRLVLKCARIWTSIKTTFPFDLHASFKNKILVYFVKIYAVDFL